MLFACLRCNKPAIHQPVITTGQASELFHSTSWSIWLSKLRSATSCFNFRSFSYSIFNRLTSATPIPISSSVSTKFVRLCPSYGRLREPESPIQPAA